MDSQVASQIDGVIITPLKIIADDRGAVLHMMRVDSAGFSGFGEVYFSLVHPGVIKGWKLHHKMTQNFVVPQGKIQLVIVDQRQSSPTYGKTQHVELGRPHSYYRVTVPPKLWYAFKANSPEDAILVNCASMPHDPTETETKSLSGEGVENVW